MFIIYIIIQIFKTLCFGSKERKYGIKNSFYKKSVYKKKRKKINDKYSKKGNNQGTTPLPLHMVIINFSTCYIPPPQTQSRSSDTKGQLLFHYVNLNTFLFEVIKIPKKCHLKRHFNSYKKN